MIATCHPLPDERAHLPLHVALAPPSRFEEHPGWGFLQVPLAAQQGARQASGGFEAGVVGPEYEQA